MSENLNINTSAETVQEPVSVPENPTANTRYTIEYCLEQMELITLQTEHLMQAMEELKRIEPVMGCDHTGASKAMAITTMIEQREETNQKLIAFYEKVYDDLKPQKPEKPKEVPSYANLGRAKTDANAQSELIKDLCAQLSNPMLDKETREMLKNGIEKAMSNMFR